MPKLLRRTDVSITSTKSLVSRWAFGLIGSVAQGLVRFLYSILIGRFVGVTALASVNSAMSVALFLSLLWPTSAAQAATRFVAQLRGAEQADQAQAIANYLGRRALAASALLSLVTIGFCLWILHSDLMTALFAGLLLLAYAGWSFARGVQYGAGQIAVAAKWDILGAGLSIGLLAAVLLLDWNALLLLPLALSYGIYAAVCWPAKSETVFDRSLAGDLNRFLAYGILGTLSSSGLLQLSMVGAHMAGTSQEAGMYAAALSLATPATMMARTMSQVLFPAMAEAGGRKDATSLKRQTDAVTRGLVFSMVGVFGALALTSPLILDIFFGNRYADASTVLPVLLMAVMFTTLPVASVNRLNSTGTEGARFVSIVAACGLLLAIALWLWLAPAMGTNGIALGYLIATIGTAALPIIRTARLDGQRWGTLFLRMIGGLLLIATGVTYTWLSNPPHWVGFALALVFLTIWLLINLRDVRSLRPGRKPEGEQADAADPSDALGM